MSNVFYAGIGARETPQSVLGGFYYLGAMLAGLGVTLRSGRTAGADSYFERGCRSVDGKCEIYTPWPGFPKDSDLASLPAIVFDTLVPEQKRAALESVNTYHPAPERLSPGAKKLMARNYCQMHGALPDDPLSDFVVCFTKDGRASGGTGQAIRMAEDFGIRVFNAHGYEDRMDEFAALVVSHCSTIL